MARAASPLTVAVRNLLTERKGEITASEAIPLLAAQGHAIDVSKFDVIKYHWRNQKPKSGKKSGKARRAQAQAPKKGRKQGRPVVVAQKPVSTNSNEVDTALQLVESSGGLSKLRSQIATMQKAVATVESLAQRVAKAS